MTRKTPAELRRLAKQLISRAADEEEKRYARIGRVTEKYFDVKADDFDFDLFKKEVEAAAKR